MTGLTHRHKITVYVTPTAFHKASQKLKEVSGKEEDERWNFRERQGWQMKGDMIDRTMSLWVFVLYSVYVFAWGFADTLWP